MYSACQAGHPSKKSQIKGRTGPGCTVRCLKTIHLFGFSSVPTDSDRSPYQGHWYTGFVSIVAVVKTRRVQSDSHFECILSVEREGGRLRRRGKKTIPQRRRTSAPPLDPAPTAVSPHPFSKVTLMTVVTTATSTNGPSDINGLDKDPTRGWTPTSQPEMKKNNLFGLLVSRN